MNIKHGLNRVIGIACGLSLALSIQAASMDIPTDIPLLTPDSFEPCYFRITDFRAQTTLVDDSQGCVVGPYNRVFYVRGHIPSHWYNWKLSDYDKNILVDLKKYYTPDNPGRIGGGGTWTWEFTADEQAVNSPNVTLELEYFSRSSSGNPDSEMRFVVPVNIGKYRA